MSTIFQKHSSLISTLEEANSKNLSTSNLADRLSTDSILMCEPTYFDVIDVKNSFMKGNQNAVDKRLALSQWKSLKEALSNIGVSVETISGAEHLEDMVFSANQVLVGMDKQKNKFIVPSKMKHKSRNKEIPFYIEWFSQRGYQTINLPLHSSATTNGNSELFFEGHGDAIWHPEKMLLWGGYGHRTSISAYKELAQLLKIPIITLELVDSTFYHLDTCFCALNKDTVMIYPGAFSKEGNKLIKKLFDNVIEVTIEEATNFACNALSIKDHVFLQQGSPRLKSELSNHGLYAVSVDTSEFMKSGGSVFCLTLDFYS